MTLRTTLITLLVALIALAGATASAQPPAATVAGTLTSTLSGEPIANATVVLEAPGLTRQVRTGADGRFSLVVPPGPYHLAARADGFLPVRREIIVTTTPAGEGVNDIRLDPELHFTEVVSVGPERRNQFDAYQPTNVLGGQELTKELQGTIGATIENEPGIALRSFGPGPARPVIRGLDGDRVLILEDGLRTGDLSSQSGDHGVNLNPAAASRLEIVRGPATLLYGANAIGGLVNVVTTSIPDAPVAATSGSFTVDAGTGAPGGGGAGDVTIGNGKVALHASASGRRADDYHAPDEDIPNSFARAGAGEVGLAYTSPKGFFGGSYAYDRSHYGIPFVEAGETNLDPRRQIFDVRGERRELGGFFESVRGSLGVRRYRHDELDGEEVATSFTNNTNEFELLGTHHPAGRLKGSIGASALTRSFKAEGEESLSPPVDQNGFAAFFYEELTATPHFAVQFGGRIEHTGFEPAVDEPNRDFTNFSGSLGLLLHPSDQTTVAVSLARASRNPALEELYFHGPHAGNNAFENGDPNLASEHALGFDASFRWRNRRTSGELTYFLNSIDNFVYRQLTGAIVEELPESFFTQDDARLQGVESHIDVRLSEFLSVEGGLDYVRGDLTALDTPLPRIPPLRGRLGFTLQKNAFQAGLDAVLTATQDRIFAVEGEDGPVGETVTDGYNVLKLFSSYSFGKGSRVNTITARLDNATDAVYHNHLNYLKDLAPEMGRSFRMVFTTRF